MHTYKIKSFYSRDSLFVRYVLLQEKFVLLKFRSFANSIVIHRKLFVYANFSNLSTRKGHISLCVLSVQSVNNTASALSREEFQVLP